MALLNLKSLAIAVAFIGSFQTVHAAQSKWFHTDGAKLRLISLPYSGSKVMEAGLQIVLEPGWKTYWRAPGSSGIPPQLNFLGSRNVEATRLDFPAPYALDDLDGLSAGYKDEVTLPIEVTRRDSNKPASLKVNGLIGVCGEICVPVQFNLELSEEGTALSDFKIISALAKAKASLPSPSHADQSVLDITYQDAGEKKLLVKAKVPKGSQKAELFVEGPYNWYLSPAKAASIKDQIAHFVVKLPNLPKGAEPLKTSLRLSLVVDGKGTEETVTPRR